MSRQISQKTLLQSLPKLIENKDAHYAARCVVNAHLIANSGLGLNDLPDTSALADIVDSIADILDAAMSTELVEQVQECLSEIDVAFIEELIFS